MIGVVGNSRARSAAASRCHHGVCRSKESPCRSSSAKPCRHRGSSIEPRAPRSAASGLAAERGLWRMPRTSGRAAWAARTAATSSRSSHACATHAVGRPCDRRKLLEPSRLADRVARIPLRLHVHRHGRTVFPGVAQVVRRQVALADRAVVPVAKRNRVSIAEPRIVVALEIPEVLMGIDDRSRRVRSCGFAEHEAPGRGLLSFMLDRSVERASRPSLPPPSARADRLRPRRTCRPQQSPPASRRPPARARRRSRPTWRARSPREMA